MDPDHGRTTLKIEELSQTLQRTCNEIARALIGQEEAIEQTIIAILARGHVLIESVPGLGKTLAARSLALDGLRPRSQRHRCSNGATLTAPMFHRCCSDRVPL